MSSGSHSVTLIGLKSISVGVGFGTAAIGVSSRVKVEPPDLAARRRIVVMVTSHDGARSLLGFLRLVRPRAVELFPAFSAANMAWNCYGHFLVNTVTFWLYGSYFSERGWSPLGLARNMWLTEAACSTIRTDQSPLGLARKSWLTEAAYRPCPDCAKATIEKFNGRRARDIALTHAL